MAASSSRCHFLLDAASRRSRWIHSVAAASAAASTSVNERHVWAGAGEEA